MSSAKPIISTIKVREISEIKNKLKNPICIHAMPGMGMTGKIVIDHLINELKPKVQKICEIYSTAFPSNVFIREDGSMDPPKITVHAFINDDKKAKHDLILITGDMQPNSVIGTNNLSYHIVKMLDELKIQELISLAATPVNSPKESPNVYITASTSEIIENFKKVGVKGPFIRGVITGMNGIIPGLAKFEFGIEGCALLAETYAHYGKDINASISLIHILNKYLELDIPTAELEEQSKKVEELYKSLMAQQKRREARTKMKRDLGYIS